MLRYTNNIAVNVRQEYMTLFFIVAGIVILILSVVLHEVAHGWIANKLGDPTARHSGRLTLNPISHIDPLGSVVIPGILLLLGGFIFGWAKPVPYNPFNLKNPNLGGALIAAAGPLTNLTIAVVASVVAQVLYSSSSNANGSLDGAIAIIGFIALINIILAIFNLLPIPPLDGSKVLFAFLPLSNETKNMLEQNGFLILLVFLVFLPGVISSVIRPVVDILLGNEIASLVIETIGIF